MDIFIDPDGGFSLGFNIGVLIALLVIAVPAFIVCWRILKKRAKPDKPKKWDIAVATVLSTIAVYIILVVIVVLVMLFLVKDQIA